MASFMGRFFLADRLHVCRRCAEKLSSLSSSPCRHQRRETLLDLEKSWPPPLLRCRRSRGKSGSAGAFLPVCADQSVLSIFFDPFVRAKYFPYFPIFPGATASRLVSQ